jgi:hypothetical protein
MLPPSSGVKCKPNKKSARRLTTQRKPGLIYGSANGSVTAVHKGAEREPIAPQEKGQEKSDLVDPKTYNTLQANLVIIV